MSIALLTTRIKKQQEKWKILSLSQRDIERPKTLITRPICFKDWKVDIRTIDADFSASTFSGQSRAISSYALAAFW